MRDCLLELGYPRGNVRCVFDGTRDQIVDAFREFYPMVRSSPRATVFVFLAGHGLESGAENGFLGVDCVDVASGEGAGACCCFSVTRCRPSPAESAGRCYVLWLFRCGGDMCEAVMDQTHAVHGHARGHGADRCGCLPTALRRTGPGCNHGRCVFAIESPCMT